MKKLRLGVLGALALVVALYFGISCGGVSSSGGTTSGGTTEDAASASENNASRALNTEGLTITSTVPAN